MTSDDYKATKHFTKEYLLKNGFRFCRDYSDEEEFAYRYRFPVYCYNITILLECEVVVYLPSNNVQVNVFDRGSNNSIYARWYTTDCGRHEPIIDIIERNMSKEFEKLGIVRKDEANSGRQELPDMPKRRSKRKPKIKDCDSV